MPNSTIQKKIELIRQKCIEANPSIEVQACSHKLMGDESGCPFGSHARDIRLADVLFFVENKYTRADIITKEVYYESFGDICARWNLLKDNLEDQSEECIDFIYQLLS